MTAYQPADESRPKLGAIIPETQTIHDIREVVDEVVDSNSFFEVHKQYAANIVVGFARLGGRSIGVVANQPAVLAGCWILKPSRKASQVCSLLRLLQHSFAGVRRCARILTGEQTRNGTASSPTVPNCSMLSVKQRYPG